MDTESELNLYNHLDPFTSTSDVVGKANTSRKELATKINQNQSKTNLQYSSKNKKKRNQKKKNSSNASCTPQRTGNKLSSYELLFFPKDHDINIRSATSCPVDLARKRNYITQIHNMTPEKKRHLRSKQDARYLHQKTHKQTEELPNDSCETLMCTNHVCRPCNINECPKSHYMRYPRFFGLCKFYKRDACTQGDLCQFMHEEYPCRFYHLDLQHPKNLDENNCRFMHGGPLSDRLKLNFSKEITKWVKKIVEKDPDQMNATLEDYLAKFELKQSKLQKKYDIKINDATISVPSSSNSDIEAILSSKQIKVLEEKGVTTIAQINQVAIDDLLEYGLTLDQILKITKCTRHSGEMIEVNSSDNIPKFDAMEVSTDIVTEDSVEDCINGFNAIELKDAQEKLQIILQSHVQFIKNGILPDDGKAEVHNEINATNQKQKQNSDSDDSDNENLVINEDIL